RRGNRLISLVGGILALLLLGEFDVGRKRQRPSPKSSGNRKRGSGFFLLQNLPALVHAGLQIEVMRTTQLAGVLVLDIGRLLQRIRRTAHASPRRRCFSSRNGH